MQQYAVISKEGVSVELPLLESEEKTTVDSEGNVVKVFDPVDASITFDDPDYSGVEAQVGEDVPAMRAIYVSSENITQDKLNEYADRLQRARAGDEARERQPHVELAGTGRGELRALCRDGSDPPDTGAYRGAESPRGQGHLPCRGDKRLP